MAQSLSSLKFYIDAFPCEYLRGRFDSEANVNGYSVSLYGAENHREVMQHDRDLCARLGMRVGVVRVYCKKGTQTHIEGRLVTTTMDKLRFHVNAKDFLRVIGSLAVNERDERLKSMIKGRRWTPWSTEVRERSIELFRSGLEPKQIASRLRGELEVDVPKMTIYFWTRRGTRSWSEFTRT
jgi:intein-encoded DNA endonuclease-like protein